MYILASIISSLCVAKTKQKKRHRARDRQQKEKNV